MQPLARSNDEKWDKETEKAETGGIAGETAGEVINLQYCQSPTQRLYSDRHFSK
ncbi:MAG TPA: hypothetical protein V6C65_06875 [Allocoleopsis sp.]